MAQVQPLIGDVDFTVEGAEEVLQNVAVILATQTGSLPLDRQFGTGWQYVDDPRPLAIQSLKADVADAIEEFEPRAQVERISFDTAGPDGRLVPTVTLSIDLDATA